jgi:GTP-binding protein HflX
MSELVELCRTAGVSVADTVTQRRPRPDPRYMTGRGKVQDIIFRAMQKDAHCLIFDHDLTPGQARALGDLTEFKVVDRTQLILDIFAQHAHTRGGKLQVELAQLRYLLPRLAGRYTRLSRQGGGLAARGPGEKKLEMDRRRMRDRITRLQKELGKLGKQREQRRSRRRSSGVPVVAIVGYTNAGKSTLLNSLTRSEVVAEDKLFATLDPTTRRLRFPRDRELVLADTVGFIRDLPKELLEAFKATLEELGDADLLLHVVDAADPAMEQRIAAVDRILQDLDIGGAPRLLALNKVDLLGEGEGERIAARLGGVAVSAQERGSTRPLLDRLEDALWAEGIEVATTGAGRFDPAESVSREIGEVDTVEG